MTNGNGGANPEYEYWTAPVSGELLGSGGCFRTFGEAVGYLAKKAAEHNKIVYLVGIFDGITERETFKDKFRGVVGVPVDQLSEKDEGVFLRVGCVQEGQQHTIVYQWPTFREWLEHLQSHNKFGRPLDFGSSAFMEQLFHAARELAVRPGVHAADHPQTSPTEPSSVDFSQWYDQFKRQHAPGAFPGPVLAEKAFSAGRSFAPLREPEYRWSTLREWQNARRGFTESHKMLEAVFHAGREQTGRALTHRWLNSRAWRESMQGKTTYPNASAMIEAAFEAGRELTVPDEEAGEGGAD